MKSNSKNVAWATFRTATQLVAIMAVILVTLIACGKSDNGGSVQNKDLIGTWVWESMTIDGKNACEVYPEYLFCGKCKKLPYFVFSDKEYVSYSYDGSCELKKTIGKYTVSKNTIVLIDNQKGGSSNFTILGNKLTFTSPVEDEKGNKHTSTMTFVKQ